MRRYLPFAIIGAVLLLGSASALLLFRSMCSSMPINVASGKVGAEPSHIRGAANARVTLEEFGDFQCKPCAVLAATLLKVEHNYGSSVRVVFRQFPLGLDVERFKRDIDSEQVKTRIKTDQERGASLGVNQTPTLYIDGARIPFPSLNEKGLRGVIDATLSGPRR
jgi:protein-disulfide isomerase